MSTFRLSRLTRTPETLDIGDRLALICSIGPAFAFEVVRQGTDARETLAVLNAAEAKALARDQYSTHFDLNPQNRNAMTDLP